MSKTREVLAKHMDALVAIVLSVGILGAAYFVRVLPALRSIDAQMSEISQQLSTVNMGLARLDKNELLRLQVTTHDLQLRLDELAKDAALVDRGLQDSASQGTALNAAIAVLKSSADALSVPAMPDLRPAADKLAAEIEAARELLAGDVGTARQKLGGVGERFAALRAEARALTDELAAVRKSLTLPVAPCAAITDKKVLAELRKKGFCGP